MVNQEEYKQNHPNYSLFLNLLTLLGCIGNRVFFVVVVVINWDNLEPDKCCAILNSTETYIYLSLKEFESNQFRTVLSYNICISCNLYLDIG